MKVRLITVVIKIQVLVFLGIFSAISQDSDSPKRGFGLKGGLNLSNISESGTNGGGLSYSSRLGFHGGFFIHEPISKSFSLAIEVLYFQQGMKYDLSSSGLPIKVDAVLHYAQLPILPRYTIDLDKFRIYFNVGPYMGIAAQGDVKYTTPLGNATESIDVDEDNGLKPFDFGIIGGAGVFLKAGEGGFFLEPRYNFGLTDIIKDDQGVSTYNRTLSVSAGYMFEF